MAGKQVVVHLGEILFTYTNLDLPIREYDRNNNNYY